MHCSMSEGLKLVNLRGRCTGSMAAGGGAKIRSFSLHSGQRPAGRRSLAEEMEGL